MTKPRQLDRIVQKLDPDETAALGQLKVRGRAESKGGTCAERPRSIGRHIEGPRVGVEREDEAGAESMGGPEQVAHIHRLGDTLHPYREEPAHGSICLRPPRTFAGLSGAFPATPSTLELQ